MWLVDKMVCTGLGWAQYHPWLRTPDTSCPRPGSLSDGGDSHLAILLITHHPAPPSPCTTLSPAHQHLTFHPFIIKMLQCVFFLESRYVIRFVTEKGLNSRSTWELCLNATIKDKGRCLWILVQQQHSSLQHGSVELVSRHRGSRLWHGPAVSMQGRG